MDDLFENRRLSFLVYETCLVLTSKEKLVFLGVAFSNNVNKLVKFSAALKRGITIFALICNSTKEIKILDTIVFFTVDGILMLK